MNLYNPHIVNPDFVFSLIFVIALGIYLILIFPMISITVRRLHDTERSGWRVLMYLGPIVLMFITFTASLFFFHTEQTQYNEEQVIWEIPDEYFTDDGGLLLDSIKSRNGIFGYVRDQNGGIEILENAERAVEISKNIKRTESHEQMKTIQSVKNNREKLFAGTAGIIAILMIFSIISFVLLIIWCALPGTEGPNKYGPDPRILE